MTLRPDAAMAAEYHDDKQQENEEQQTSNYSADASRGEGGLLARGQVATF